MIYIQLVQFNYFFYTFDLTFSNFNNLNSFYKYDNNNKVPAYSNLETGLNLPCYKLALQALTAFGSRAVRVPDIQIFSVLAPFNCNGLTSLIQVGVASVPNCCPSPPDQRLRTHP